MLTLYVSDNLTVRLKEHRGADRIIVTFNPLFSDPGLNHPGFAQALLEKQPVSAIYFTCRCNSWYQYPEIAEALSAASTVTKNYRSVMTYGLSMGGYAALVFAKALNATDIISVCPQFTADSKNAHFEPSWLKYRGDKPVYYENHEELARAPARRASIIYDPASSDARAVKLYAQLLEIDRICVPFGGHTVGTMVAEMGQYGNLIRGLVHGTFDKTEFISMRRSLRTKCPTYWREMHWLQFKRKRYALAAFAAWREYEINRSDWAEAAFTRYLKSATP